MVVLGGKIQKGVIEVKKGFMRSKNWKMGHLGQSRVFQVENLQNGSFWSKRVLLGQKLKNGSFRSKGDALG